MKTLSKIRHIKNQADMTKFINAWYVMKSQYVGMVKIGLVQYVVMCFMLQVKNDKIQNHN